MVIVGLGVKIGNEIAGAALAHSWIGLQAFSGAVLAGAALLIAFSRVSIAGLDMRRKV
jgi:hypothetical protein